MATRKITAPQSAYEYNDNNIHRICNSYRSIHLSFIGKQELAKKLQDDAFPVLDSHLNETFIRKRLPWLSVIQWNTPVSYNFLFVTGLHQSSIEKS
jgi:hypothetical protein